MNFTKQKVYYIIWDDHWSLLNKWQKEESLDDSPVEVHTIGWCLKDSPTVLHMASTVDSGNQSFGGHMAIMKNSIKNAWEITGIES